MSSSPRLKFVVENDSFLRLIQVVLDPTAPEERIEAFAHFCKHDLPDFRGWCDRVRSKAPGLHPVDVRLVDNQAELLANLFDASVAVVEELTIGPEELKNAGYEPTTYKRSHTPNGNWARIPGMITLYGRQLGIVGLGEIGRELALRAIALGMRIVYTQRTRLPADVERQYQARYFSLEELLATSDCVSLHLPRGPATVNFIGDRELSVIKTGAFLINVSQPTLVDREALRRALASGHLGGYGLDTFYEEPGDAGDPLIKFPNVIVTPHLGGSPRWNSLDDIEEVIVSLSLSRHLAD